MPGICVFERRGGSWLLIRDCEHVGGKSCPGIANFRQTESDKPIDDQKESHFLATFQAAFGPTFRFAPGAMLELTCNPQPATTTTKSELRQDGKIYRFTLGELDKHGFAKIENPEVVTSPV